MSAIVVGLAGNKRVGKDTVGSFLVGTMGFTPYALATPVKRACAEAFGFDESQLDGASKDVVDERLGFSPRHAMQQVGTECFRRLDPEFAIKALERFLERAPSPRNVVITDVRFQNEVDAIHRLGGVVWLVKRPGYGSSSEHAHESERADRLQHVDAELSNDGSVADLHDAAFDLLRRTIA